MTAEDLRFYQTMLKYNQDLIDTNTSSIRDLTSASVDNAIYKAYLRRRIRSAKAEIKWLQANVPGINY